MIARGRIARAVPLRITLNISIAGMSEHTDTCAFPRKCFLSFFKSVPFPCGENGPRLVIYYMVPWAHQNPDSKRHLGPFSRFSAARGCDQQTDLANCIAIVRVLCSTCDET